MFAFRSIRLRLTLWYVLVLALILAGFSAGVYLTLRHNLYSGLDDSLETRSNDLQSLISSEGGAPTLAASLPSSRVDPGEQFVRVFNVSGQATFEDSATPAPVNRQSIDRALAGRAHTREASIDGEPFRILSSPIERDGQIIGVLEVGRATDDVRDTLNSLLLILLISYPATLVVASFAGMFLAGRALSPIDRLTRMAQRISAEDLSQRLDLRLPDDEIGRLARTFDEMIARLEGSFLRQRQFTADASHELRTPLAAIKGQVEVALSRPRNQVHYQEVLHAVNEEIDRLIRLVGSLLTLARADAGQIPIAREPVELAELVSAAIEQVRTTAELANIQISSEPGPAVVLQGDEDLLLQLLLNLLDNAIKYTPAHGRITAGWNVDGKVVRLWVRDTGIGISPEHQSRIFERFYAVDRARSRSKGGAGLGLSISLWIAEVQGGLISVESEPGQGSTFTVNLPL